ncbi:unannotated protein [freshwater metagenome]|uniref:Unannotated protein n=1 Tax=freshwater metagenome TaxID=449393 RepID=A0A6J7PLI2_9ZZZZ
MSSFEPFLISWAARRRIWARSYAGIFRMTFLKVAEADATASSESFREAIETVANVRPL